MPPPEPVEFFTRPDHPRHVQFEILRLFFAENLTAEALARRFGIAPSSVYGLVSEFRRLDDPATTYFVPPDRRGRPPQAVSAALRERILELRDRQLSVPDIKAQLDAEGPAAPGVVCRIDPLRSCGFDPDCTVANR